MASKKKVKPVEFDMTAEEVAAELRGPGVAVEIPAPRGPKPNCVCASCQQMTAVKPAQIIR